MTLSGRWVTEASLLGTKVEVLVEDGVLWSVKAGRCHFRRYGVTNCVSDALPQWASGSFHARGFPVCGMARCGTVQLAEVLDFVEWEIEAREVQPPI